MALAISALITGTWPDTESKLSGDSDVDYSTHKDQAIERSKVQLYTLHGDGVTIPAESAMPNLAKMWIADQAVVFLIPLARDWYMNHAQLSNSKENANFSYHDHVAALDTLRDELRADLNLQLAAALKAINASEAEDEVESTPAVSVAGNLVDPTARAWRRGPF